MPLVERVTTAGLPLRAVHEAPRYAD